MGISNKAHFDWLKQAVSPICDQILKSLPTQSFVLGLGEHKPNPLLKDLFQESPFHYMACDLYPQSDEVFRCDINDLAPLSGSVRADVVCCLRTSYFISNKWTFFEQIRHLLKPGAYLIIDFLVGSSGLPVVGFEYGDGTSAAIYDPANPSFFKTTFYDDRLLDESCKEVEAFCKHARNWPLRTRWSYFRKFPKYHLSDVRRLQNLQPHSLGDTNETALPTSFVGISSGL